MGPDEVIFIPWGPHEHRATTEAILLNFKGSKIVMQTDTALPIHEQDWLWELNDPGQWENSVFGESEHGSPRQWWLFERGPC